jgi:hypothetical protein
MYVAPFGGVLSQDSIDGQISLTDYPQYGKAKIDFDEDKIGAVEG